MSRYIDADAFLKEYCEPYPHVFMAMLKAMAEAPHIDIVRCGECKYKFMHGSVWECLYGLLIPSPDGYCSYGERSK